MLCLVSIGMEGVIVISELFYKGTILQKNYRKMTIKWSFSYNSFVKFHVQIHVITRLFIKGLHCIVSTSVTKISIIPGITQMHSEWHEIISTVILLPSAESFKKGCCQLQAKVCARSTG